MSKKYENLIQRLYSDFFKNRKFGFKVLFIFVRTDYTRLIFSKFCPSKSIKIIPQTTI